MKGILFSIAAGLFISLQSVFNTRVGEKIGFWETNTFVHATGLVFTFIIMLAAGSGGYKRIGEVNKLYLVGGLLGVLILFSVMNAISALGATYSVAILMGPTPLAFCIVWIMSCASWRTELSTRLTRRAFFLSIGSGNTRIGRIDMAIL
jgi:hypothetical protein